MPNLNGNFVQFGNKRLKKRPKLADKRHRPKPNASPALGPGGLQIPAGLVVGLAPATLESWARFPNERNQGIQGATPPLLILLLLILFNAAAATSWPRSPPLPLFLPRL